jgi:hypothetical protein
MIIKDWQGKSIHTDALDGYRVLHRVRFRMGYGFFAVGGL